MRPRYDTNDIGFALVMGALVLMLWFIAEILAGYVELLTEIRRYAQRNAVAPAVPARAQHDGAVSLPSEGGEVSIAPSGEVSIWP